LSTLSLGEIEFDDIRINKETTLNYFKNNFSNIKVSEGISSSFVYFLTPRFIYTDTFQIQIMFVGQKIRKVILTAFSETEEEGIALSNRHRKWLIDLIGEELGIKSEIEFQWGRINPWVDRRSNQAEIHISYY
jgi:hypothetical protein